MAIVALESKGMVPWRTIGVPEPILSTILYCLGDSRAAGYLDAVEVRNRDRDWD